MNTDLSAALAAVPEEVAQRLRFDRLPLRRLETSTADLLSLRGRVALVTGGGGDGLGFATCHRLAEQGAQVAVLDRSEASAVATRDFLTDRWGVDAIAVAADVGARDEVAQAVARVLDHFGRIDVLVNNAGGSLDEKGLFQSLSDDYVDRVIRLNLTGLMTVTKAVLGPMKAAGAGRIINVSSEGGKISQTGNSIYASCKSAVIGFTRNLAKEIGPQGLSAVGVCPGIMIAGRTLEALRGARPDGMITINDGFARATIGRCSVPDEVASMIAFLASDAGSYVHGTSVSVGGGLAD